MLRVAICRPSHGGAYASHEECMQRLLRAEPSWDSLERRGCPCVDIARSVLAEEAILGGYDVCLWIDADMTFSPDTCRAVVHEAIERNAVVGCVYAGKKLGGDPQCVLLEEEATDEQSGQKGFRFFEGGRVMPVEAIGFGLVAHPVSMLDAIAQKCELRPQQIGEKFYRAWFTNDPRWDRMHSDDYSFCRRAREAGFSVFADTRQRVGHIGLHTFHLEDMQDRPLLRSLLVSPSARPDAPSVVPAEKLGELK